MKRIFAVLLAMTLAAALFAGCGAATEEGGETTAAPRTTSAGSPEVTATPEETHGELGPLTKGIFAIYTAGGTYHVKYVGPMAGGGESTDDIYAKGGNLALMAPGEEYNRMIIKEGYYYQVNDDRKAVIKTPLDDIAGYPIPPDTAELRYIGSGRADFKGEELDYDEYYHSAGFQAFYFVKDGVLKGIRHAENGFAFVEVQYLVFEAEVPDSVFDIPANYTVTGD